MGVQTLKEMSVEELRELVLSNRSKLAALASIGIDKRNSTAIKYLTKFIEDHNVDTSHYTMGVPLTNRFTKDEVSSLASKANCWSELMRLMGIRFVGNNILTVKKVVEYYDVDVSHFDAVKAASDNRMKYSLTDDAVFCENSTAQRATVKKRLIVNKLVDYKCEICNNGGMWNGSPLVLHLEHKNGVNNDNRIENLCFLCPNCHSQTATYAGRNLKKDT